MLKSIRSVAIAAMFAVVAVGCARIETGEVGLRRGFDKQIQQGELLPGTGFLGMHQTLVGEIVTFPYKDVNVDLSNLTPVAKDNSTMADLDLVVTYNINPTQVAEIYSSKDKAFHTNANGDTYLMYNYVVQLARNAAYKAARQYEALEMADNREKMEDFIKAKIIENLSEQNLGGSITIGQVLIRNVQPAASVVASANELVKAKNEKARKQVEVDTAELEAKRMAALSNQSAQSIAYMNAQSQMMIAEGVKNGKVNAIIVPQDFKGIVNVK